MLAAALGCGEAMEFDRAFLTTVGRSTLEITRGLYGDIAARAEDRTTMQVIPLSRDDVSAIAASARRLAVSQPGRPPNPSFEDILAAYRSRRD